MRPNPLPKEGKPLELTLPCPLLPSFFLSSSFSAITNGATALAEGFLFFVGVSLIAAEAYRSSRSAGKRRDDVDDKLDELKEGLDEIRKVVKGLQEREDKLRDDGSAK